MRKIQDDQKLLTQMMIQIEHKNEMRWSWTYSSDDIDDWCNVSLILVDLTVLFGDQTPESVNVNSWAPQTVLQNTEGSHTDLTEVTWMA